MKRLRRILFIFGGLVLAVVLLVAIGLAYVYFNRNELIRTNLESTLSWVLVNETTVGSVNLQPFAGELVIEELFIGNPEGFESVHAMRFGKIEVALDMETLGTELLTINHIRITEPDINYDRKMRDSNLNRLVANASRFQTPPGEEEPPPAEEPAPEGSQQQVLIREISVISPRIRLTIPVLNESPSVQVADIVMRDVGAAEEDEPATPAEVLQQFFNFIIRDGVGAAVEKAGVPVGEVAGLAADLGRGAFATGRQLGEGAVGTARDVGEGAVGAARDVGGAATGAVRDVGEGTVGAARDVGGAAAGAARDVGEGAVGAAQDAGRGIGRAVGGLFGRNSDNDEQPAATPEPTPEPATE